MSISTPTPSPIDISPPLALEDSTHHGALIAISASISICLILFAIGIRVWARTKVGPYWIDDYAFLVASFFAGVEAAVIYFALNKGFGQPLQAISPANVGEVEKAQYSAQILYITCMFFSKCSTAFFLLRLTPRYAHIVVTWSTIGFILLWAMASVLVLLLRCHNSHPWTDTSEELCKNLALRWMFVVPMDIITELALFGVSVHIFWSLRIAKKLKTIVVAAFGARLPVIIIIIIRLHYLRRELSSTEPTLLSAYTVSVAQFEISYSILATIVPCLKPFITAYDSPQDTKNYQNRDPENSNYKLSTFHPSNNTSHSAKRAGFEIFDDSESERKLLRTRKEHSGFASLSKEDELKLRPECTVCEATVEGNSRGFSEEDRDSLRMVIIKDVAWRVDYEVRDPDNDPANL